MKTLSKIMVAALLSVMLVCFSGCGSGKGSKKGYDSPEKAAEAAAEAFYSLDADKMLGDVAPPGLYKGLADKKNLSKVNLADKIINDWFGNVGKDELGILKSNKSECKASPAKNIDNDSKADVNAELKPLGVSAADDIVYVEVDVKFPKELTDKYNWEGEDNSYYCCKYNGRWYAIDEELFDMFD